MNVPQPVTAYYEPSTPSSPSSLFGSPEVEYATVPQNFYLALPQRGSISSRSPSINTTEYGGSVSTPATSVGPETSSDSPCSRPPSALIDLTAKLPPKLTKRKRSSSPPEVEFLYSVKASSQISHPPAPKKQKVGQVCQSCKKIFKSIRGHLGLERGRSNAKCIEKFQKDEEGMFEPMQVTPSLHARTARGPQHFTGEAPIMVVQSTPAITPTRTNPYTMAPLPSRPVPIKDHVHQRMDPRALSGAGTSNRAISRTSTPGIPVDHSSSILGPSRKSMGQLTPGYRPDIPVGRSVSRASLKQGENHLEIEGSGSTLRGLVPVVEPISVTPISQVRKPSPTDMSLGNFYHPRSAVQRPPSGIVFGESSFPKHPLSRKSKNSGSPSELMDKKSLNPRLCPPVEGEEGVERRSDSTTPSAIVREDGETQKPVVYSAEALTSLYSCIDDFMGEASSGTPVPGFNHHDHHDHDHGQPQNDVANPPNPSTPATCYNVDICPDHSNSAHIPAKDVPADGFFAVVLTAAASQSTLPSEAKLFQNKHVRTNEARGASASGYAESSSQDPGELREHSYGILPRGCSPATLASAPSSIRENGVVPRNTTFKAFLPYPPMAYTIACAHPTAARTEPISTQLHTTPLT